MSDLRELYQEIILEHNKKPRNFGPLPNANHHADGYNPLCGDRLHLDLLLENGRVQDIRFQGSGCAIFKASASMMTAVLKGKSVAEANLLFEKYHEMLSRQKNEPFDEALLGKLAVFSGVCEYPVRVKCATLAWHTLKAGLEGQSTEVSTDL